MIFINKSAATTQDKHSGRHRVSRSKTVSPVNPRTEDDRMITLNDTLAAKAVESGQIDLFWRAYMPHSRDLPVDVAHSVMGGWLLPVQQLCRSGDPLLRRIVLALALAATQGPGRVEEMRAYGFQLYSDALAEVAAALLTPKQAQSNKMLAAVKLFSLYEVWPCSKCAIDRLTRIGQSHYGSRPSPLTLGHPDVSSGNQARTWLSHIQGHITMILSRSPVSFIDGISHRFFVDSRCHLVS